MNESLSLLFPVLEQSLQFKYECGDATTLQEGYFQDWRTMPWAVVAHHTGGTLRVELASGEVLFFAAGDLLCIPAGSPHRITKTSQGPSVSTWAHFNFEIFGSVDLLSIFDVHFRIPEGTKATRAGQICAELAAIASAPAQTLQSILRKKAMGFDLASLIMEEAPVLSKGGVELDHIRRMAPVISYIQSNLDKDLSREQLASIIHLSPSQFYKQFKSSMAMSPSQFVQNARIQRAEQMLITTDLTINRISQDTGYADPFHFSRLFKKRSGMGPSLYRKQVRESLKGVTCKSMSSR